MHYIYLIVNKVNGKTYVGQHKSNNWQDCYMGSGTLLRRAMKKYDKESFEKFLIQYCNSKEEADRAEVFWIAEYRKRGKAEYNIADGGASGSPARGYRFSEEQKRRMSEKRKGHKVPESQRKLLSKMFKGKPLSEEAKQHMRKKHKSLSIETRLAMSEGHKGLSSGMKDKHWYTNGVINVVSSECPDGFQRGRV